MEEDFHGWNSNNNQIYQIIQKFKFLLFLKLSINLTTEKFNLTVKFL